MREAPAGFREVQAEEATGVRVDKDALGDGVVVKYKGARRFPRASEPGTTTVQIFITRGGTGQRFSVFGTAQLDSKLRNVKKDSVIWIRYGGKKVIDGNETHDWQISDAGARLDDLQIANLCKNSEREHVALDRAIAAAAQKSRAPVAPVDGAGADFEDFPGALDEEPEELPF
jgi:hypothetical protein